MEKLTLTLADTVALFRACGIRKSKAALADDIAAGIYPFGRVTGNGERRSFEIFRKDVEAFLQSKI